MKTVEPVLPPLDRVVFFDIETVGIDRFVEKVITVQVRHRGKTTIWKEWELGEAKCIEAFFDFLKTIYRKETSFVGYNHLKFDVSFIDQRLRELGIMNKDKWQMLHDYLHWVDSTNFWRMRTTKQNTGTGQWLERNKKLRALRFRLSMQRKT